MKNNILIVDDLPKNIEQISAIVKSSMDFINIYKAYNGLDALDVISQNNIDLIILDLALPKKDGLEVLTELKSNSKYKDIPVIIYSGISNKDVIKKTLEIGAMDYFAKPLKQEDIDFFIPLKVKNALNYYNHRKHLLKINEINKKELSLAKILQNSLMFVYKSDPIVEVHGKYLPSTGLGGDAYDCVTINDKVWFMIADIMGHGVASAMVSFMVKALFNQLVSYDSSPKDLLKSMNTTYCNMMKNKNDIIFSIFVGTIKNSELTYSSAGHPYPILYKNQTKTPTFLENNNMLMGVTSKTEFHNIKVKINPKDLIFLYTDGLYERSYSLQGIDTIMNYIKSYENLLAESPEIFIDKILNRLTMNKSMDDDIAILAIKKK